MNIIVLNIIISILIISLIILYYFINNKENFYTTTTPNFINSILNDAIKDGLIYNTKLECMDDIMVKILDSNKDLNIYNNNINDFCDGKTHHLKDNIHKFPYIEESKAKPSKIDTLHIEQVNNNTLKLSWFRPKSEHLIKKYICILETNSENNNEPIRIDLPNSNNSDYIEHIIKDLTINKIYKVHVLSENKNGFSDIHTQITILKDMSLLKNDTTVEKIIFPEKSKNLLYKNYKNYNKLLDKKYKSINKLKINKQ